MTITEAIFKSLEQIGKPATAQEMTDLIIKYCAEKHIPIDNDTDD